MDMIEPTSPLPTTTTSTGFNFVAATLFPLALLDHDVFCEALRIDLRVSELDVENAHRLGAIQLGIGDVIPISARGQAGKSQKLPAHLASIAAVHRVGKVTLFGIAPEQVEKELRGKGRQRDPIFFERLENLVLLAGWQLVERLFVCGAAVVIDLPDADAIDFLRDRKSVV